MVSGNKVRFLFQRKKRRESSTGTYCVLEKQRCSLKTSQIRDSIFHSWKADTATNSLNCYKTRMSMALRSGYKAHSEPNPQEMTYCAYLYINLAYIQCHHGNKSSSLQIISKELETKGEGRGFPSAIIKNNFILILDSNRGKLALD